MPTPTPRRRETRLVTMRLQADTLLPQGFEGSSSEDLSPLLDDFLDLTSLMKVDTSLFTLDIGSGFK